MDEILQVEEENKNVILSRDVESKDVYEAGPNIAITPKTHEIAPDVEVTTYEISGRDWSDDISQKQDKLEFGYREDKISSINDSAIYYEPANAWKQWSEEHGSSGTEDAVYIGKGNNVNHNVTAIGDNNKGSSNSQVKILGDNNDIGDNVTYDVKIIGNDNKPSSGANDTSYDSIILGDNNSGGSYSVIVGNSNKSINGSFNKVIIGYSNTDERQGNTYVLGQYNKITGTNNKPAVTIGYLNSANGGFAFGTKNDVSFSSTYNDSVAIGSENKVYDYALGIGERNSAFKYGIAIGTNNSSDNGGWAVGKYNSANQGARVVGDYNSASNGGMAFGYGNKVSNGGTTVGESNFASTGGGAFGKNNVAGKGGWSIGESNKPQKYNSNTSSYEDFTGYLDNLHYPAQYAFGYNNYTRFKNNNTLGLPIQIGMYNYTYETFDYDGQTYNNSIGSMPFAIYNIGNYNSAVNYGINIGGSNLILTGDGSVAASINIGKYLVNRYGVLIGQNIESSGYGIGLGDNIKSVNAGDTIIGTQIYTNSGRDGKLSWDAYSRTLVGRYLSGYYTYDASIFGSYICAFSGRIPNRTSQNEWCYGIGYGSIVIGTHIKGGAQYGSMIIAQNGQDADKDQYNNIVPIVANYDSTIIGGYSNNNYDQTGYYINPGISAYCNGLILGQGQQMTANYNSIIVGQQSIAMDGSKVFGTHGYARGASMVINPSPMSYNSQSVTVAHINGIALTSAPEIYGSYTAEGVLKRVNGSYSAEKIKLSGDRIHRFNRTPMYYWTIFHKTNATNENSSFVAFNLTGDGWLNQVNGYWNNDKTVFTPNASYGYNAVRINWTRGALLLRVENGEKKLYEYNENTSGTVNFPQYADYYYTGYPNYNVNYFYTNPSTEDYYKYTTPNSMLLNNIVTDGKFIYKLPGSEFNGGNTVWSYVTGYIPTSFSGSQGYEASATYYYDDGKVYTFPKDVTAYGFNGLTGQISTTTSSVYPSAVYDVSSMITNSTANYGSIAIGQKNSAYGGSIAINTQSQSSNNGWTAQHSLTYINNKYENKNYYCFTEDSTSISITGKSEPNLPTYRSAGFNASGDAQNLAQGASVAIGIGTKGGWTNSAYNESLVIGSKSTAVNNSFVLGRCASAYEHAFAFGHSNGCTAGYQSYSLGGNGCSAIGYSYAFGHDGINAENHSYVFGSHGVTARNNSLAFGVGGVSAGNQGIALGFFGVSAENIDNGGSNGWGIAIGSQGVMSRNGGIAFGYKGVSSENTACIAIGSYNCVANGSPAIAIGHLGTYAANWAISIGAKGRATNQSINLSMGSYEGSYTTAENGSINILAATHNSPAGAFTKSISIRASEGGATTAQNGSINIISNSTGRTYTTANNQSMILATKYYHPQDAYINAYNNSMVLGAGILLTSAVNDSISIGGGKFIDNNSYTQQIYNGSIAAGYGNTANGGVYVVGNRNFLGTTYTAFENRPIDYTQSFVVGESNTAYNYRPYIWANKTAYSADKYISAYISTDSNKCPHGNGSASYTRNMIVGNFNLIYGYNDFIFGLNNTAGLSEYNYNSTTDTISGDKNDDGFALAFGMNNYAARNYDIAMGYGSTASGGENIAIYGSTTYGQNNIAIGRSKILTQNSFTSQDIPRFNIALNESILSGESRSATHNIISYAKVADNEVMCNNLIMGDDKNYGIMNNKINDNFISNTPLWNSMVNHSILMNTFPYDNVWVTGVPIREVTANHSIIQGNNQLYDVKVAQSIIFGLNNFKDANIYNSFVLDTDNTALYKEKGSRGEINNNIIDAITVGVRANEIAGSLVISDGQYSYGGFVYGQTKGLFIGDNYVSGTSLNGPADGNIIIGDNNTFNINRYSFVHGHSNVFSTNYNSFDYIYGDCNILTCDSMHHNRIFGTSSLIVNGGTDTYNDIIGEENKLLAGSFHYNRIHGKKNTLQSSAVNVDIFGEYNIINEDGFVCDTRIYGKNHVISNKKCISNHIEGISNILSCPYIYQSYINGKHNIVANDDEGSYVIDTFVFGTSNTAYNSLTIKPTMGFVYGQNNIIDGPQTIAFGSKNVAIESNATVFGMYNKAVENQFIIGKYNEFVDRTPRYTSAMENGTLVEIPNSGVLFAIGNGRLNAYEDDIGVIRNETGSAINYNDEANMTRSNAMIVSANGLVSASNLATSGFADIDATLSTLTNFGTWEIVTGTTTADITTPNSKTIYLIKNTTVTGSDQYEEWICTNTATPAYEKIGDTSIDLSQYVPLTSYQALENRVAQLETLLTTYSARWVLTQV